MSLFVAMILAAMACVNADCNSKSIGYLYGHTKEFIAVIPPYQSSGRLVLDVCSGFNPNGAFVSACDNDKPSIYFKEYPFNILYADVVRNGSPYDNFNSVKVIATVFCPYPKAGSASRKEGIEVEG